MTWYYVKDGEAAGPISEEELISKVRAGSVLPTTLVWRTGMTEWEPVSKAAPPIAPAAESAMTAGSPVLGNIIAATPETAPGIPPVLPHFFCTFCGTIIPADQLVRITGRNVCGACKPNYVQQVREGMETPFKAPVVGEGFPGTINNRASEFADPWTRLVAHILDLVFIGIPIMVAYMLVALTMGIAIGTAASGKNMSATIASSFMFGVMLFMALAFVWVFFYWTFFLGRSGSTPGMKIMKVKMVRGDRGPVGYGRAFGRAVLLYVVNAFTMSLTNITAFYDRERRTVVDMICDTRVVPS